MVIRGVAFSKRFCNRFILFLKIILQTVHIRNAKYFRLQYIPADEECYKQIFFFCMFSHVLAVVGMAVSGYFISL